MSINHLLIGVVGLIACLLVARRPFGFLALYLAYQILIWTDLPQLTFGVDLTEDVSLDAVNLRALDAVNLPMLAAVVYALMHPARWVRLRDSNASALTAIIGFLVCKAGLAIAAGQSPVAVFGELRDVFAPVFCVLYVILFTDRDTVRQQLGSMFIWVSALVCGIALYQFWKGGVGPLGLAIRPSAQMSLIALHCAACLWFCPGILRHCRNARIQRSLAVCGLAIAVASRHRAVWAAVLGAVLASLALYGWRSDAARRSRLAARFLIVGMLAGATALVWTGVAEDFLTELNNADTLTATRLRAFTDYRSDNTASWRLQVWENRLSALSPPEWVYGRELGARRAVVAQGRKVTAPNHNAYVTTLEVGGVTLVALHLALVLGFVRRAGWRKRSAGSTVPDRGIVAACLVCLAAVHGWSVGNEMQSVGMIMLGVGMVATSKSHVPERLGTRRGVLAIRTSVPAMQR